MLLDVCEKASKNPSAEALMFKEPTFLLNCCHDFALSVSCCSACSVFCCCLIALTLRFLLFFCACVSKTEKANVQCALSNEKS